MERMLCGREFRILCVGSLPVFALAFANGWYGPQLKLAGNGWFWALDIVQFIIVPILSAGLLWRWWRVDLAEVGLLERRAPPGRTGELVWFAIVATLLYLLTYNGFGRFIAIVLRSPPSDALFASAVPAVQPWRVLVLLYAALSAAFIEELVFRAVPWIYFKARFRSPRAPYVLCTAIAFGITHWEQGVGYAGGAFLLGVAAAIIYAEVKNLWPLIGAHFLAGCWNYQWS